MKSPHKMAVPFMVLAVGQQEAVTWIRVASFQERTGRVQCPQGQLLLMFILITVYAVLLQTHRYIYTYALNVLSEKKNSLKTRKKGIPLV